MASLEDFTQMQGFDECKNEAIERKKMGRILEAGRNAPSPGKRQTLEFVVIEDEGTLERLSTILGDNRVKRAPVSVVILTDPERMKRAVRNYSNACYAEALGAAQNMRILASSEGLCSNLVTDFDSVSVCELLDAPEKKNATAVVSFGYSEAPVAPVDRFGLGKMCFYDEYGSQIDSVFDGWNWEGYEDEKRRYGKRVRGFIKKLRDSVTKRL